jgi:Protein of unknown function (DUF2970)
MMMAGFPIGSRVSEVAMSVLRMLRMVLWSFFGVRKSTSHQADMAAVKAPLLPLVAIMLAACFGGILFCLAKVAVVAAR